MRILLIPLFVGFAIYYGQSVREGNPQIYWKWAAVTTFGITALSDALDGYVARKYNQITRLGGILDPLADKLLMVSAIITLSLCGWPVGFPLWFPILVVSIHLLQVGGALLMGHIAGLRELKPHWTGKVSTFLQLLVISMVLLELKPLDLSIPTVITGLFVVIACFVYMGQAFKMLPKTEIRT